MQVKKNTYSSPATEVITASPNDRLMQLGDPSEHAAGAPARFPESEW